MWRKRHGIKESETERFVRVFQENHQEPEWVPPMLCTCQLLEEAAPVVYNYDREEVYRQRRGDRWTW
jgi:hypothetical protein